MNCTGNADHSVLFYLLQGGRVWFESGHGHLLSGSVQGVVGHQVKVLADDSEQVGLGY